MAKHPQLRCTPGGPRIIAVGSSLAVRGFQSESANDGRVLHCVPDDTYVVCISPVLVRVGKRLVVFMEGSSSTRLQAAGSLDCPQLVAGTEDRPSMRRATEHQAWLSISTSPLTYVVVAGQPE